MVMRMWKFMWMNDKWSLMWFNNLGMWVKMSMIFTMADIMMSKIVMFWSEMSKIVMLWGEMSILSLPIVMSVVYNVSKTMVSKSMFETMSKSMVNFMVSFMRSKSRVVWLLIKAMLRMVSVVSILGMGIVVVWIKWSATFMSNMMSISLVTHIMGNFGEIM